MMSELSATVAWMGGLAAAGPGPWTVCGNADVRVTARSLARDVVIGTPARGYLLSGVPDLKAYWDVLETLPKPAADARLGDLFRDARLWEVGAAGAPRSFGAPSSLVFPYTATVKDCVAGARTTLGADCSRAADAAARLACCREKFTGPRLAWTTPAGTFTLRFSPDPSVRLKVPGEARHRYCDVKETLTP